MSKFVIIFTLLLSFGVQASLTQKLWSFVDYIKEKIGLVKPVEEITLPQIPQPKNNPLDLSVYNKKLDELYPSNELTKSWDAQKKKQVYIGFIKELFEVTLVRNAKRNEIEKWYNVLEQGSPREGVYQAIVLGDSYRHKEVTAPKSPLIAINFTKDYLKKFLEQKTSDDLLKRLDCFSLKRIIVDNTLKTVEVLEENPDYLFRWYAVFSKDLAEQFPSVWKYQIRASKSDIAHYRWANSRPLQHIKSEIIFKLHKVYNDMCQIVSTP